MTGIALDIRLAKGDFRLRVDAQLPARGVTAVFGPSGSGKSTLLRTIAGFERPEGRIAFGDEVWSDGRRFVPPHRRRIGFVFQDARLFPHLDVAANLRYAARRAPGPDRFEAVVADLDLGPLLGRQAPTLSGGEAQRVAIGRALLSAPRLILMDEPLSALDVARRAEVLPYLEALRDMSDIPILYVSHAIGEVVRLARNCLLMDRGKAAGFGPVAEVLGTAHEDGGADGTGTVVPAEVRAHAPDGLTELAFAGGVILSPGVFGQPGSRVHLLVRARDVMIATERPAGLSALNILPATVLARSDVGEAAAEILLDLGGQRLAASVTRRSADALGLAPGRSCFAILKSVALSRG